MAPYQLIIFFLPKKWENCEDKIHLLFDKERHFLSEIIWKKYYEGIHPARILNSTFGTMNKYFWQSSGETDYSIELTENGNIAELRVRIDCRNYSQGELKRVLSFAHILECNLFFPEFSKIIEPNSEALEIMIFLIRRSKAFKYINGII